MTTILILAYLACAVAAAGYIRAFKARFQREDYLPWVFVSTLWPVYIPLFLYYRWADYAPYWRGWRLR